MGQSKSQSHLQLIWRKCQNTDGQWDRVQEQTFQGSCHQTGHEILHTFTTRPQSNEKIKGFHRFLKACIAKHINHGLEWDEFTPMATACYNFFPNCSARESAFFIMFGRDPINKLNMMLHAARRRYFHDDNGLPNLEALKTSTK